MNPFVNQPLSLYHLLDKSKHLSVSLSGYELYLLQNGVGIILVELIDGLPLDCQDAPLLLVLVDTYRKIGKKLGVAPQSFKGVKLKLSIFEWVTLHTYLTKDHNHLAYRNVIGKIDGLVKNYSALIKLSR